MKRRLIDSSEDMITARAVREAGLKLLEPPVILIVVRGMILVHTFPVAVTTVPVTINQDMKALKLVDDVEPPFMAYWLEGISEPLLKNLVDEAGHGTQVIRMNRWRTLRVPVPPVPEQQAIVAFLDYETTKIDALIAKKERLLELLDEKSSALVGQAVNRGIDPHVARRDSGVDFLGEVPSHWDVKPYKRVTKRVDVGIAEAATHAYADEGVAILRSTNVRPNRLIVDDILRIATWFAEKNRSKYLFASDLVTVRTGVPGTTAVIPAEFNLSQCFTMLISTPGVAQVSAFLSYFLNSPPARSYFETEGWGTAQTNISVPILQMIPTPVPPEREQRAIVEYIQRHTTQIDALSKRVQQGIDVAKELRSALISAAVTGQIDVRTEAA
jgi:type I restriction enzyme S subunit